MIEQALLQRARKNDQRAFYQLFHMHLSRIQAVVRGRVTDGDDVDDLVQLTFIKAFKALHQFREEASFATWLTRIAMNTCSSFYANRRTGRVALDDFVGQEATLGLVVEAPDQELERRECQLRVRQGIQRLEEPYQKAVWMRYVEDYTYQEIVRDLHVPDGTVKIWLYRGRQQLQRHLRTSAYSSNDQRFAA